MIVFQQSTVILISLATKASKQKGLKKLTNQEKNTEFISKFNIYLCSFSKG